MDTNNFGYLIYVVNTVMGKNFNKSIHKIVPEVTGVQFTILIYLYHNQSKIITQRMITDYLHLSHPTVRHIIKLILKKGLINLGALPSDHRQIQIMISQKGNRLIDNHLATINHDYRQFNQRIIAHISNKDQRILKLALEQIIKNFSE